MKTLPAALSLVVALAGSALPGPVSAQTPAAKATRPAGEAAVLRTKMALRDLWVEHIFWVRSYVIATHAKDAAQAKAAEAEIVSNAKAISSTITPFYGQGGSDKLFELLAGHWGGIKSYATAAFSKSADGEKKANEAIVANAHAIADFLEGANPNLPATTVFGLLATHAAHHTGQIYAVRDGDYAGEAKVWAPMRQHMLALADAIVDALAKQQPEKF